MKLSEKQRLETKRRTRVRSKIIGLADRPRLSLCFTNKHVYAQCINDVSGNTLVALSSLTKDLKGQGIKANCAGAEALGKMFGSKLKDSGINSVVFDRSGRAYHGCVKAFADAVRSSGINF